MSDNRLISKIYKDSYGSKTKQKEKKKRRKTKNKSPVKKWAADLNRQHLIGQQTHEKMLNILPISFEFTFSIVNKRESSLYEF